MHKFVGVYPDGAIKNASDLLYIIATNEDEPTTLYAVVQSGHISKITIRPNSKIERTDWGADFIMIHGVYGDSKMFLGDRGIASGNSQRCPHNSHRTFLNLDLAFSYSQWMKNDEPYKESVRRWHKSCDGIFRGRRSDYGI